MIDEPPNKGMKQTSVEHIGRSQLIPGVGQYSDRTTTYMFRGRAITDNGNDDDGACDRLIG